MIVELVIGAGVVMAGAYSLRRLRDRIEPPPPGAEELQPAPIKKDGLEVGDVLLYSDTELWLAGEVTIDTHPTPLRIFPAPGGAYPWVAQLDEKGDEVAFLRDVEVPEGKVPAELRINGMMLSLRRRGEGTIATEGETPLTTEKAKFVLLGGPGGRVALIVDFVAGDRWSMSGLRVTKSQYDRLPGK